jgi:hypothetical protein
MKALDWLSDVIASEMVFKWTCGVLILILTIFSEKLLEKLKFAMNRANLRTKQFEQMAMDLSNYIFSTELLHEYYVHGFTDAKTLNPIVEEYNDAITVIRRKEHVYRSWVARFWKSNQRQEFEQLFSTIINLDKAVHSLDHPGDVPPKLKIIEETLAVLKQKTNLLLAS